MLLGVVNIARETHFKHNESYNFKYKPLTSTVHLLDWQGKGLTVYQPVFGFMKRIW
jgi:hypothetical protein